METTLIEKLYNNNVIFSYYGFVDTGVLSQVLQITRSKLASQNEPLLVTTRVLNVIQDCVESIVDHNFYPDDTRLHYKSLLVVSRQGGDYEVDTLNVVNNEQKEAITAQLVCLSAKSREQLKKMRLQCQLDAQMPVSERIVGMLARADQYDCSFKPSGEHHLFNISLRISTTAEPVLI